MQADFAHATFVDGHDIGHLAGEAADFGNDLRRHGGVHEFIERHAQETQAIPRDDAARDERGPVIGALVAPPTNERDADAHEGSRGRKGVGTMMPGVTLQGGALNGRSDARSHAKECLLNRDDDEQHGQSEPRGGLVRRHDFMDALYRDEHGCAEQEQGDDDTGHGLGLAVAIGMILVRRHHSQAQSAPDHERAKDIRGGFDAVGDEHPGMAEDAHANLQGGKQAVHDQSQLGDAKSVFERAHVACVPGPESGVWLRRL